MNVHDTVMRELVILSMQHLRLSRTYEVLGEELRRQHKCGSMKLVEECMSRAITLTNRIGMGEALPKESSW